MHWNCPESIELSARHMETLQGVVTGNKAKQFFPKGKLKLQAPVLKPFSCHFYCTELLSNTKFSEIMENRRNQTTQVTIYNLTWIMKNSSIHSWKKSSNSLWSTALQWGLVSFIEQLTTKRSNVEINKLKRSIQIIVLLNNKCHLIPVLSGLSVQTERNYSSSNLNFFPLNKRSLCSINDKIHVHLISWLPDTVKSHGMPASPASFKPH